MTVAPSAPPLPGRIVFSALDAEVAGPIEQAFAKSGALVVTNSRNHRMEPDIPLLIPEVNSDHLPLLQRQRRARGWPGGIVANPNCSTAGLVMALAPLHRAFGVEKVFVSTLQALSGAGYPGVPSLDILGNVIPYISKEEEKMEEETLKLLGKLSGSAITPASFGMSAHCNRVAVEDGHTESVSIKLKRQASAEEIIATWREFRAEPQALLLPSAPSIAVNYLTMADRPQPRFDVDAGAGMTTTVGRLRPCSVLDWKFTVLSHNTIRGAAGAALLNAELLKVKGYIQ
jgi:aspartate-semialdehyde dehydrogenase